MAVDALQDVDQIVIRIDIVWATSDWQALDDADTHGAQAVVQKFPFSAEHLPNRKNWRFAGS